MYWKLKSKIQNIVSLLPSPASYTTYYWIQRHFGILRQINPVPYLKAGIEVCERIEKAGRSPAGGVFLEVGTGRRINMPITFWLAGAAKVITVDINPYLKEELVKEDIKYIRKNIEEVKRLFNGHIHNNRFNSLLEFTNNPWRLSDLLDLCRIEYRAPADAAKLPLPPDSIDFHVSYSVFEHIPPNILKAIIEEGNRIIKDKGLLISRIDYRDHFARTDKSISPINFLQYSDDEWDKTAGNRYMYMNRLRVDDFHNLLKASNHRILISEPIKDPSVFKLLENGNFKLNDRFAGKSSDVLATVESWTVSEKCN